MRRLLLTLGMMAAPVLPPGLSGQDVAAYLLGVQDEVRDDPKRFAGYRDYPVEFADDILGIPRVDVDRGTAGLWSSQVEILEAVRDEPRVVVLSGHGTGKTYDAGILVTWWLLARQGNVLVTANTWEQVRLQVWAEIHRLTTRAPVPLPTRGLNLTEWRLDPGWWATGLSPAHPELFAGHHHPDLLVLVDEASGLTHEAATNIDTTAQAPGNRVVMIGNPLRPSGPFYDAARSRYSRVIRISCLDHPNVITGRQIIPGAVTREWVDRKRTEYGEGSGLWLSRVLGQFPASAPDQLMSLELVERQMDPRLVTDEVRAEMGRAPVILGLDVARQGGDECVLADRRGRVVGEFERWRHKSTMATAGRALEAYRSRNASIIVIDIAGFGAGVYDRLVEQGVHCLGYLGGRSANDPRRFTTRRAEIWWSGRSRLESGELILPADPVLREELTALTYEYRSDTKIILETKGDLIRRIGRSPDTADAFLMTLAADLPTPVEQDDSRLRPGYDPQRPEDFRPPEDSGDVHDYGEMGYA